MYTGQSNLPNSLVFGYDSGEADGNYVFNVPSRFYTGRPTSNLGPIDFADWGTEGSAERISTGRSFRGQPTYNCRTTVGESWRGIDKTISGLRTAAGSSGTVTMSCFVKNNNPSSYSMYAYIGHDFSSTRTIAANSDWQVVQWTVNQSSMNNDYVEFRPYTNNASIYLEMTMPQVEVNTGSATQFTTGTRGNTNSLLDLKRAHTIDLSNAGFNNTGHFLFDGTNDYINVSNYTLHQSMIGTIEAVVYLTGNTGNRYLFGVGGTTTYGATRALRINSSKWGYVTYGSGTEDWGTNVSASTGAWQHVGIGWDGTNVKFWKNGTEYSATRSGLKIPAGTTFRVGMPPWTTSDAIQGKVPIVRHYDTLLTEAQMQSNFNKLKNRFTF